MRLYVVNVSFEYAVVAESEREACSFAGAEAHNLLFDEFADAREAVVVKRFGKPMPPDGWGADDLVYGADGDMTWAQAVKKYVESENAK